jgi:uncharacterized protein (TIGR03118 family)
MKINKSKTGTVSIVRIAMFLSLGYFFITGCQKALDRQMMNKQLLENKVNSNAVSQKPTMEKKNFTQVNLVANNSTYGASRVDPLLQNAWGLAFTPNGFAWISANGASVSTIYTGEGAQVRPAVTIPSATGSTGGTPTGVVFSGSSTDFLLPAPNNQAARFIFAGEDGVLSAWNGAAGNNAVVVKDNSAIASYKSLALATNNGANYLYAANFSTAKIDVFDKDYNAVSMPFRDPQIPSGFAPFNVQNIDGMLYITYAKVGPDGDDVAGMGNGYVDIYNTDGSLVKRLVSAGQLNSPWGIAKAPAGFFGDEQDGDSQDIILIGNFGNGHINAYHSNGKFIGELAQHPTTMQPQKPLVIDGLWAISFAPVTATAIDPNRLYFTAGPNDEGDGLYGYIQRAND